MLSSELRPNESAGWIKEDLSKTRGRRRKFGERAASTEGEGRVSGERQVQLWCDSAHLD